MESNSGKVSKTDQPSFYMEKIPKDIYFDILSRLPITSLIQCKFVSKFWKSSTENPELANMHLSSPTNKNICLVLHSECPKFKLLYVHIDESNSITSKELNISFHPRKFISEVVGSSNGFLCLSHTVRDDNLIWVHNTDTGRYLPLPPKPGQNLNASLYIYNPFNKVYKKLPTTEFSNDRVFREIFGFGFDSRTKAYKVIKIVIYRSNKYAILDKTVKPDVYVFTSGKTEWRNIGKIQYFLISPSSETLVNGKLHWLIFHNMHESSDKTLEILSFDLATEEFQEISRPDFGVCMPKYHLVELKGCLSTVLSHINGTTEVWVMKNYGVTESWKKELVIRYFLPSELGVGRIYNPGIVKGNGLRRRRCQVLCFLSNGDVLLQYHNRYLVSFNPDVGVFKEIIVPPGLQFIFNATVHVGSLISVNSFFI